MFSYVHRKAWGVILVCLIFSGQSLASEQDGYFHLHQAYEYLEGNARANCVLNLKKIRNHLSSAEKDLMALPKGPLLPLLSKLRVLVDKTEKSGRPPSILAVETIRGEIQAHANLLLLKHDPVWHVELGRCSSSSSFASD